MSKILIGRYIPGKSPIYEMDPRGKLIACILFIFIIFLINFFIVDQIFDLYFLIIDF